ncbi:Uncharacterised protein [Vibrio cholerae]|nr:Uncharacterised protein [Vibrio cholerae]
MKYRSLLVRRNFGFRHIMGNFDHLIYIARTITYWHIRCLYPDTRTIFLESVKHFSLRLSLG